MNCNANFNYLGVEAANLSELHEPFIRMIREWSVDGARVAKTWYGCRGWVGHHNIDLWRAAAPVSGNPVWAAFICGGAWASPGPAARSPAIAFRPATMRAPSMSSCGSTAS